MKRQEIIKGMEKYLKVKYGVKIEEAKEYEIFNALSLTLLEGIVDDWNKTTDEYSKHKKAYYFSAEYLMGRALGNNLISLGLYDEVKDILEQYNININKIEEIEEDAGLGNGGLGRLAACFMDSAATLDMPLTGYGIRYSNGLFNQKFVDGFQMEEADNWLKYGDPWSVRKDRDTQIVEFSDMKVKAVPYDTPIIGYGTKNINTLRLWKCEAINEFDFNEFNDQKYDKAVKLKNRADDISRVLYPNDSNQEGKLLRLRQQYFLVSASLKDILKKHKEKNGEITKEFSSLHAVQLNDTHPTLAIPEFIRILVDEENVKFEDALEIAKKVFAYTNHTILAEALEKWDVKLIKKLFPRIHAIIVEIDKSLAKELKSKGYTDISDFKIIANRQVRMANLAIYVSSAVNGVAQLHTDILKDTELNNWYKLYPTKFQNKTNGITPRRWLRLCNQELSALITELLGSEAWVKDLSLLEGLKKFENDEKVLKRFMDIKHKKKEQLADYIKENHGIELNPDSLFDIQIKRLHEYKRQLLNAFYILDLYYRVKENPSMDIPPVTFIFGAKAFPGYRRAKAIVKFINEIGRMVNNDASINGKIKVVFVENYRVSYGEKLFPAADLSKQISTAGKEASGTGNMKFMLNGTPTFGTLDGANVEIAQASGEDNNFIFGLKVEEIEALKGKYSTEEFYSKNKDLKKVIDSLIDGTFDDGGSGDFQDLYNSLMKEGDQYFLLADFESFKATEDQVFAAYKDEKKWAQKCFANVCNSGVFSSDRTILQYCEEIWNIKKTPIK
ncbi:glycogen/starch/alpha-glucan phosphorylase [Inconstantimicrobium mannanitabidum]|uniref:Alpha-1,4 glucan phosphorylase n=1 Tax=Inconstantimicrobium mannanitabidum TaxID=1604901 RepID=A0ACB5RDA3_9CLOT|nr:glycogen/starch/alpha-glucan phosphorylase [Clostridium sp. TW13]GKX67248.1 alpha-1,4 glucan phosphorylase [Clostridium sp. TW13]